MQMELHLSRASHVFHEVAAIRVIDVRSTRCKAEPLMRRDTRIGGLMPIACLTDAVRVSEIWDPGDLRFLQYRDDLAIRDPRLFLGTSSHDGKRTYRFLATMLSRGIANDRTYVADATFERREELWVALRTNRLVGLHAADQLANRNRSSSPLFIGYCSRRSRSSSASTSATEFTCACSRAVPLNR